MSKQNKKSEQETNQDPLADLIQPKAKPVQADSMAAMEQELLQTPADNAPLDPETLAALSNLAEMEASLLLPPPNRKPDWLEDEAFPEGSSFLDDDPLAELLENAAAELLESNSGRLLDSNADSVFMAADLAEAVADADEDIWEAEEMVEETAVSPTPAAPVEETVAETAIFNPNHDEAEPLAIFQQPLAATDDEEPLAIFQQQMATDEVATDEVAADVVAVELADAVADEAANEADALTALSENIASAEEDEALAALQDTLLFAPPPATTLLSADESDALAALQPNGADTADPLSAIISSIDEEVGAAYGDAVMADLSSERLANPVYNLRQYVIFTLAGETYAAPASHVREVAQLTAVTRIPNVPNWLMGVTNLRGDVLSLIGLRAFLGLGNNGHSHNDHSSASDISKSNGRHDNQIMVVQSEKLTSAITTGLVVDEIQDIRFLNTDQIGTLTAPIEDQVAPFLEGVYEENGRLLVLLDLEKLLLSPAIWQFDLA